MDKKKIGNTNIPITFQKMNIFDDRFVQVKIWLMHLGENYNGSYFSKSAVERAIPTLRNTPILGFIEENAIGEDDYSNHRKEITIEDGELKEKYLGRAYGMIPETNNARFEVREGDDGIEREYLVVDGLMWTKFDDSMGILDRDEIKGQSMELNTTDYDGHFNDEGLFVFDKFSFNGACILGDGVQPAMQRATVEKMFTADEFMTEVGNIMEEFKANYGKLKFDAEKEGNGMNLEQLLEKYGVSNEQLEEKGINPSDFEIEELENKIKEAFEDSGDNSEGDNSDAGDNSEGSEGGENSSDEGSDDDEGNESDDDEDDSDEDDEASEGGEGEGSDNPDEDDEDDESPSQEEYESLKSELETLKSDYASVVKERDALSEFKADSLKLEHEGSAQELFAQFDKLEEDDISDLRENVHDFTLEQIEEKLFARVGRKQFSFSKSESKKSKKDFTRMNFSKEQSKTPKKSYAHILEKYKK